MTHDWNTGAVHQAGSKLFAKFLDKLARSTRHVCRNEPTQLRIWHKYGSARAAAVATLATMFNDAASTPTPVEPMEIARAQQQMPFFGLNLHIQSSLRAHKLYETMYLNSRLNPLCSLHLSCMFPSLDTVAVWGQDKYLSIDNTCSRLTPKR